jgi:DNA-binding Lrp family transcriptional regulator
MELKELLTEQVLHELKEQGLKASRRSIYYLEKKNLVKPRLIEAGTRHKRFYSQGDFRRIVKAVRYTNMGFAVDVACDLLMKPPTEYALFLVGTKPGMACRFADAVREYEEVQVAATIWGSLYDVLVKVAMWHRIDRDILLSREFPRWGSRPGMHKIHPLTRFIFSRDGETGTRPSNGLIVAYVFISIAPNHIDSLTHRLADIRQVMEMAEISGDMNVVARIEVKDNKELDYIILDRIKTSAALATKTYLFVDQT